MTTIGILWAISPEEALILIGLAGAAAGLGKAAADALSSGDAKEGERIPIRVRPDRPRPGAAPDDRPEDRGA